MLWVVLGITYGGIIGWTGNWLTLRVLRRRGKSGRDPAEALGVMFLLRLLVDAGALFLWWGVVRDTWSLVAAAVSITVAVKVSLWIAFREKGGKFE